MKFTKIAFFITLMAANVTSLYGMDDGLKWTNLLRNEKTLPEYILGKLQESEDYESLVLEEQENSIDDLQALNYLLLQNAIKKNCPQLINFLVEKNINLSKEGAQNLLEYNMALKKLQRYGIGSKEEMNQKGLIAFLINKGIDVNQVLREAINQHYPAVVEVLIQHGAADVNGSASMNISPLNVALMLDNSNDKSRIINALLDAGANTNLPDGCGNIPENKVRKNLDYCKHTDWAQRILGNNPLPNTPVDGNLDDNKDMDVEKSVPVKFSSTVWYKTLSEQDTLKILQESGDYEQRILEEQRNSMKALQGVNDSILQNAIDKNYPLLINFLVEKNINLSKEETEILLDHYMITKRLQRYEIGSEEERDQKKLITFLIEKGIDLNKALSRAIIENYPAVVEVLIKKGAVVDDGLNSAALMPLHAALYKHSADQDMSRIINALLDAGANIARPSSFGRTPEEIIRGNPDKEQTDWAQRILGDNPILPESSVGGKSANNNPLPNTHVGGNPDDNKSVFNAIKTHKGFAFVGGVIGVGVVVWCCKKLYEKYYDDKKNQEEDESEQAEQVAD